MVLSLAQCASTPIDIPGRHLSHQGGLQQRIQLGLRKERTRDCQDQR